MRDMVSGVVEKIKEGKASFREERSYPKAVASEGKWVDFDEDSNCWGIFGLDSGHCYQLCYSESEANRVLKEKFGEE